MSDAINPDHYKRLPVEAIEIIEAMIAEAPDNKAAYLHGQAAKYDLRLWGKGKSLEDFLSDWGKHIWYALRLESHLIELIEKQKTDEQQKASYLQSLKDHPFGKLKEPAIKQSLTTEPLDGWRWLEVGEVIRKGDQGFENGLLYAIEPMKIGMTLQAHWMPTIRRNRFEVGENVVDCETGLVSTVQGTDKQYSIVFLVGFSNGIESKRLAPHIEDAR